jgi:glycosyltransferase involved in cell wall biosynthesis
MKISVCLATYNGEKYIKDQLDSILIQLDGDDEIVISDDSSTDSTVDIVNKYDDSRIKIFNNQTKNPITNFENAIYHAHGDVIFLSDQDDIWEKDKVRVCIDSLKYADLIVSDCKIVDSDLNVIQSSFFELNNSQKGVMNNLWHNSYIGCCMAFKRKILKEVLPFPKDIPMHDSWIGFVCDLFYKSLFLPIPLILYRRHDQNATQTSRNSPNSILKKILFRWNLIKYIPLLLLRKNKKTHDNCLHSSI